jgi:tetratricopeptide (TPR) repeat protein
LNDLDQALRLDLERGDASADALAEDHLERGRVLFRLGRLADALTACEQALAARPELPAAQRLRAEALIESRRFEEALAALDRYLSGSGRGDPAALRARGIVRSRLGHHAGALEDFGRSLEIRPDPETHAARGWAYLAVEAWRLALPDFEEAVRLAPNGADARMGRAMARAGLGQPQAAAEEVEEALRLGPTTPRLAYNAARALALAADRTSAMAGLAPAKAAELKQRYLEQSLHWLTQAVTAQPVAQRAGFWSEVVQADPAFQGLSRTRGYEQLAATLRAASDAPRR